MLSITKTLPQNVIPFNPSPKYLLMLALVSLDLFILWPSQQFQARFSLLLFRSDKGYNEITFDNQDFLYSW